MIIGIYYKLPSSVFIIFFTGTFSVCMQGLLMSLQLSIYIFDHLILYPFSFYCAHLTKSKLRLTPWYI